MKQPEIVDQFIKARMELGGLTSRVLAELEDLSRPSSSIKLPATVSLDADNLSIKYNLVRGHWIDIGDDIHMMLIDERPGCRLCPMFKGTDGAICVNARCDYTRALMESKIHTSSLKHMHPFNENITVIRGWLKETESGSYIEEGSGKTSIVVEANTPHKIQCMGLFMLYWSPCKFEYNKILPEIC